MTGLIERLRATHERGIFDAVEAGLYADGPEAADALEALKGFARHRWICAMNDSYDDPNLPCTCGLSDLLAKLGGE